MRRRALLLSLVILVVALVGCSQDGAEPNAGRTVPAQVTGGSTVAPTSAATRTASVTTSPTIPPSLTMTAVPPTTSPPYPGPPEYVFPVVPPSAASYGQTHHDYPASDVFAACGLEVVAVTAGVVEDISRTDEWDAATDDPAVRGGLSISIVGDDDVRYYASHLLDIVATVESGGRVSAGQVIAHVGDTGNAAGTGCHVHFGISPNCGPDDWAVRRGAIYPWPFLDAWRDGQQTSPTDDVADWLADHPDQCATPHG